MMFTLSQKMNYSQVNECEQLQPYTEVSISKALCANTLATMYLSQTRQHSQDVLQSHILGQ
jgi:hypothetical protein